MNDELELKWVYKKPYITYGIKFYSLAAQTDYTTYEIDSDVDFYGFFNSKIKTFWNLTFYSKDGLKQKYVFDDVFKAIEKAQEIHKEVMMIPSLAKGRGKK